MDFDYDALLTKGKDALPKEVEGGERFAVPKVKGHLQGNKTVISNFGQIANILRRPVQHLLKYISRELASAGEIQNNILILGSKVPASRINEKIQQYTDEFVICRECSKPDTKLEKIGPTYFLKCSACGAKYSIKSKI